MIESENEILQKMKIGTLGEFLKFHREEKKYSIGELSAKTKIRVKQLENLENNNFMDLPSRVYLVGFLKTLCAVLEVEVNEAIVYLNQANINEPIVNFKKMKNNFSHEGVRIFRNELRSMVLKKRSSRSLYKVFAFVAVLGTFFVFFVFLNYQRLDDKVLTAQVQLAKNKDDKLNNAIANNIKVDAKEKSEVKEVSIIKLAISAKSGDSWLAYKTDQGKIVKFILKQGRSLELVGERIRLMIGNPQALQIEENGSPVLIEKKSQSTTAHLIFPKELERQYKPPYFVFNQNDGTVLTTRQFKEKVKGI